MWNKNNWSVQNEIQRRAEKESTHEWATKNETIKIPQVIKKCESIKNNAGWINFFLSELRP